MCMYAVIESDSYCQGWQDYALGIHTNPFEEGTLQHAEYYEGYVDSKEFHIDGLCEQ